MKHLSHLLILVAALTSMPTAAFASGCPCGSDCPCGSGCPCGDH